MIRILTTLSICLLCSYVTWTIARASNAEFLITFLGGGITAFIAIILDGSTKQEN